MVVFAGQAHSGSVFAFAKCFRIALEVLSGRRARSAGVTRERFFVVSGCLGQLWNSWRPQSGFLRICLGILFLFLWVSFGHAGLLKAQDSWGLVGAGGRFRSAGAQRERFRLCNMLSDCVRSSLGSMGSLGRRQAGAFFCCLGMSLATLELWRPQSGSLRICLALGSLGVSLGQVGLMKALLGGVCVCLL